MVRIDVLPSKDAAFHRATFLVWVTLTAFNFLRAAACIMAGENWMDALAVSLCGVVVLVLTWRLWHAKRVVVSVSKE